MMNEKSEFEEIVKNNFKVKIIGKMKNVWLILVIFNLKK